MNNQIRILPAAAAVLLLWTGVALADHPYASIALHILDSQTSPCNPSALFATTIHNSDPRVSTPNGPFFFVYVLSCNGSEDPGVSGFECGLDYQGGYSATGGQFPVNIFSWHLCADNEAPVGWPAPRGSNLITWLPANCQKTRSQSWDPQSVIAVGGYFYLAAYGPAEIWLTPRSNTPHTSLLGCDGSVNYVEQRFPSAFGVAGFGGMNGYNPCVFVVPNHQATWGHLKSLYRP